MRLETTVPPNVRLVRSYGGDQTIAAVEHDAELLDAAGLKPIVVTAGGFSLYRELTAEEAAGAIARENGETPGEQRAQKYVDSALESFLRRGQAAQRAVDGVLELQRPRSDRELDRQRRAVVREQHEQVEIFALHDLVPLLEDAIARGDFDAAPHERSESL